MLCLLFCCCVFCFKQKTAYEMRISDWSSDVCSSDLKFDAASAHMIPDVIRRMHAAKLSGAAGIDIWNSGEARREFMYVGDLADAIYRHIDSEDAPDVMNIGLGHDHSILDYYRAIQKIVGWDGQFRHDMSKPLGMQQKLVEIGRAHV